MAETKNSAPDAFDKDALKEWFTLAEVAERWTNATKQTITEDDLLHFGEQALLEVCFQTKTPRYLGRSTPYLDDNREFQYWTWRYCKNCDLYELGYISKGYFVTERGYGYNNGLYALEIPNIKRIKYAREIDVYGGAVGLDYVEFGRTSLNLEDPSKNHFLALPERVNVNNLLITKEERDRFEKENRIGAYAGTMPDLNKPDRLDPRKETTYLQIIRALLAEVKMPQEPYKAADALMEAAAAKGLVMPAKRDTIAEKLKAARDLSD